MEEWKSGHTSGQVLETTTDYVYVVTDWHSFSKTLCKLNTEKELSG